MSNATKTRISELTALTSASLDTTIVGVDNGVTYKIELDTLADAVTTRVNILDRDRLAALEFATSSFETKGRNVVSGSSQLTSSYDARYVISGSIGAVPVGTVSGSSQVLGGSGVWSGSAQLPSGIISGSSQLNNQTITNLTITNLTTVNQTASVLYTSGSNQLGDELGDIQILSGSVRVQGSLTINGTSVSTQSFVDVSALNSATSSYETNGRNIISSSTQISDLGFVTGSYTTINSFNSLTQSFNSISQSFTTISGSVGGIDFSTLATTGSNTFIGNQTITGSVGIRANSGSWNFKTDGTLVLPNGTGIYGNGLLKVDVVGGFLLTSYTDEFGSGSQGWYFHSDGILNVPGNIEGAPNLLTTSSFNSYTASISTASLVTSISNLNSATSSYLTSLSGAISSSSQITYTSISSIPSGIVSGSSQITNLGYATTGSNVFSGSQTITGSLNISGSAIITGSVSATSFNGTINATNGVISGSSQLTSSFDTRYVASGSISAVPAGTISGSSQLTSSYDSRYSLSGSVLTSFSSSVDTRLDTLEGTIISGSVNYVQTLGARVTGVTTIGVTIITGSITTTGNPIQIMVTGDANPVSVTSWTRLQLFRNETAIGNIVQVENSSNLNVPYCLNVIDTPSAGTYTYSMRTVSGFAGNFDFGESEGPTLTAVELNSKTSFQGITIISGSSQLTSSFDLRYLVTGSVTSSINALNTATSSYETKGRSIVSGSSQLTSSFDTRYAISASFVSSSNLSSIQTITSASYAALTPVSGTLYIIIG